MKQNLTSQHLLDLQLNKLITKYAHRKFLIKPLKRLKKDLKVIYPDQSFNKLQLNEIFLGLNKGLDISCYLNHQFNNYQMQEIRETLEKGFTAFPYANTIIFQKDMQQILSLHRASSGLKKNHDISPNNYPTPIQNFQAIKCIITENI